MTFQKIREFVRPFVWRLRIAYYRMFPSPSNDVQCTRKMLALRNRHWPEVEANFDAALARLNADSVCLDLGANVGSMTVRMAETGATVHAFEPDPYTFQRLQETLDGYDNVILHNAAVGAEDGTLTLMRDARFDESPDHYSVGTGAYRSTLNQPGGKTFDVPMVGFRGFLESLGKPADLVKMDIEGSEVEVLEDLLDTRAINGVRALFVETHEAQMPELRQRTKQLRRRISRIKEPAISLEWH